MCQRSELKVNPNQGREGVSDRMWIPYLKLLEDEIPTEDQRHWRHQTKCISDGRTKAECAKCSAHWW